MLCVRSGARRGLRWGLFSCAAVVCFVTLSSEGVDARRRKVASNSYSPPFSAIVVDANSGAVLHATSADALRHPASLTKIMTLYLLFEQLEAGKLKLDTPLKVSKRAADQAPTKLDLEEGQTIKVEDAIKGMVTRSANDAAVVVAEALAGSEAEFATMMTRKAQALGMTKTVYKNASGLPHDEQVTTAREQAILGRAIQERFPTYYKYFQTRSFVFRGEPIGNHNRLLGSVDGVDGIKTGFTQASGFNLVTSMHRNDRYVVAVVLGGSSAASRDTRMRQLLSEHLASASTKRTAPMIADAAAPKGEKDAHRFNLASVRVAPAQPDPPGATATRAAPGSTDPIRPVMVKTLNVKPPGGAIQTASAVPLPFAGLPRTADAPRADALAAAKAEAPATPASSPATPATPPEERPGVPGASLARTVAPPVAEPASAPAPAKQTVRSGWIIQVGAYPDEEVAKQQLITVKSKASQLLAAADPFTEPTVKDGTTYYRARFAGLNKDKAEAACKYLKRNDVDCMAIKN